MTRVAESPGEVPTLPEGRRAVLFAVRRRGDATAEQIAAQLGITVSGARQHLSALASDGLVEAGTQPAAVPKRGRPTLLYSVTELADTLFPKSYGELTNELLSYVVDSDPAMLETATPFRSLGIRASADEIEVNLGSLDAPDQLRPTYELWIVHRESWLPPFPLTRRYDRDRDATGRFEE